jgi:hypothetical protein
LVLLDHGQALLVEGRQITKLDRAGKVLASVEHEFMGGWNGSVSSSGRWVARVTGDYDLRVYDMDAKRKVSDIWLGRRSDAIGIGPNGTAYVARAGSPILRRSP